MKKAQNIGKKQGSAGVNNHLIGGGQGFVLP